MHFHFRFSLLQSAASSSCRIEVNLNHKLLLDKPCSSDVSLAVSLAESDGWHELEVSVLEPVYATVRTPDIAVTPFLSDVSPTLTGGTGLLLGCFKFRARRRGGRSSDGGTALLGVAFSRLL